MSTSRITRELHVHKPIVRTLMSYVTPNGERVAKVLDMSTRESAELVVRTLRWAALNGIEITFRPV